MTSMVNPFEDGAEIAHTEALLQEAAESGGLTVDGSHSRGGTNAAGELSERLSRAFSSR